MESLSSGDVCWRSIDSLASAAGLTFELAEVMIRALDVEGWIDVEEPTDGTGTIVCLSEHGAEELGARVVFKPRGAEDGDYVWRKGRRRRGRGSDRVRRGARVVGVEDLLGDREQDPAEVLAELVDVQPGPAELVEAAEMVEMAASIPLAGVDAYPKLGPPADPRRPTLILGIGVPWFGVVREEGDPCPGCGGRRLAHNAVCVYPGCERWGLDYQYRPKEGGGEAA